MKFQAGAPININPWMGSIISYYGLCLFTDQIFFLGLTLQTDDVPTPTH